ncbi:MAG TPA: toll/interleukin-1 receptor domain-containing protein, partial [Pyrinomonadaceae bacterium]|nr:toll/interleukin-1 receptor domain-containing protein [Pyrinomonadaceae bacterium]
MAEQPGQSSRTNPPRLLKVFLCHASEDKDGVRELYRKLRADGVEPWLDEEALLGGQRWAEQIVEAVEGSDVVIVCLSPQAVSEAGFRHREIKL